jgi:hypothetical protein
LQVDLIGSRLNGHLATAFSERLALTRRPKARPRAAGSSA